MKTVKKYFAFLILFLSFALCSGYRAEAKADLTIKVSKSISAKIEDERTVNVKVYYQGRNVSRYADLYFRHSNKSVATIEDEIIDPAFSFHALKKGTDVVTITAKYKPALKRTVSAKATCKITVKPYESLRAKARLTAYDTRDNYFTVEVKNISNRTMKILSKDSWAYEDHYESFDRELRLLGSSSSVTISPGQKKTVYFKVIGRETWYDYEDFQVGSYWQWGGKTYWVTVYPNGEVWRKVGNDWKWIAQGKSPE